MADCSGTIITAPVYEDGRLQVGLPFPGADLESYEVVGQFRGAVRVMASGDQLVGYGLPSGVMVDICVRERSDAAKKQAAKDEAAATRANEKAVGKPSEAEVAQAEADQAQADAEATATRSQQETLAAVELARENADRAAQEARAAYEAAVQDQLKAEEQQRLAQQLADMQTAQASLGTGTDGK